MKYRVTLIHNDSKKSFEHDFEAIDLDDAWNAVAQYCMSWNCVCDKLINLAVKSNYETRKFNL